MHSHRFIRLLLIFLLVNFSLVISQDKTGKEVGIGDTVPLFEATDQDGKIWRLKDHLEKEFIVIYFYPAAMTGGCTKQACGFRDAKNTLDTLDVEVVGISGDDIDNLKLFARQNQLNFRLLSDEDRTIADQFGVNTSDGGSVTRTINGKEFLLKRSYTPSRWTYIINNKRQIVYKETDVDAANDAKKVIKVIEKLKSD